MGSSYHFPMLRLPMGCPAGAPIRISRGRRTLWLLTSGCRTRARRELLKGIPLKDTRPKPWSYGPKINCTTGSHHHLKTIHLASFVPVFCTALQSMCAAPRHYLWKHIYFNFDLHFAYLFQHVGPVSKPSVCAVFITRLSSLALQC